MEELVRNGKFDVLVGHYAHPGGDPAFSVPWCVFSMNVADGT